MEMTKIDMGDMKLEYVINDEDIRDLEIEWYD